MGKSKGHGQEQGRNKITWNHDPRCVCPHPLWDSHKNLTATFRTSSCARAPPRIVQPEVVRANSKLFLCENNNNWRSVVRTRFNENYSVFFCYVLCKM